MRKVVDIGGCYMCPYYELRESHFEQSAYRFCTYKNRELIDDEDFPEWCPLPEWSGQ